MGLWDIPWWNIPTPKEYPQMRISGGSDKGECASKVCKDLEEKTECGLSKFSSSGREWCYKCEKIGENDNSDNIKRVRRIRRMLDSNAYCIGDNWDYCDSTC